MRGAVLGPDEAERWGLVTTVADDDELDAATDALVAEFVEGADQDRGPDQGGRDRGVGPAAG